MTERIALRDLLENTPDMTFVREMISFAANRPMELDTESLCGAALKRVYRRAAECCGIG